MMYWRNGCQRTRARVGIHIPERKVSVELAAKNRSGVVQDAENWKGKNDWGDERNCRSVELKTSISNISGFEWVADGGL